MWIFGYGSLMWRPGFDHVESQHALLRGAHRSLCVYSYVHRGTEQKPGLVLGLDTGGSCRGIAFRVDSASADATIDYLRSREQVTMVYREALRRVELLDGSKRKIQAVCFLVDRMHRQYAGRLPVSKQAELVARGRGVSGDNVEYVVNTLSHLDEMGLRELALQQVLARLEP
ncbi:MAG: gamma-glutamylcyclotransferase [Alphaproteobacteria bacterium]